jgi:hypothetical protein
LAQQLLNSLVIHPSNKNGPPELAPEINITAKTKQKNIHLSKFVSKQLECHQAQMASKIAASAKR